MPMDNPVRSTIRIVMAALFVLLPWAAASTAEPPAEQSPRVALIIGNSAYTHAPLANPVNDANLIAGTLKNLGFQVLQHSDLQQKAMKLAIREFGDALERAGPDAVGLFYYSGHGIQLRGHNYMLPVNARIERESDIDIEGVAADTVLGTMEFARNRLNLVIMDACRNNPFARGFRSASRGLARMDATKGTLIAYSTSPGMVAADGEGDNSPYTRALAASMQQPGLPVERVFKQVRKIVMAETRDQQVPWESSSLTGDFYFSGSTDSTPAASPAPLATGADSQVELAFWGSIEDSRDPAVFRAYLDQFPNGVFAGLARIRQQKLTPDSSAVSRGNQISTPAQPASPAPASNPRPTAGSPETAGTVSLSAPDTIPAGSTLQIAWTGPDDKRDLITIVEAKAGEGAYGNYRYTKHGNPLQLKAPDAAGDYQLRYLAGNKRATLASLPIRVTPASAELNAPTEFKAGDEIAVDWKGPDNARDLITIVERGAEAGSYGKYRYTNKGTPLKIQVPDSPGDYEIRYLTGQTRKTLASRALKVLAVNAGIEVPKSVTAGAAMKLHWQGPDNQKDFITIVEANAEEGKYGNYSYTSKGNPLTLQAPDEAGRYEIRYLTGQSRKTLFSAAITVAAATASLEAAEKVTAGARFDVQWTGPDNQKDFITIVANGAEDRSYGNYSYTKKGSPLQLQAPDQPGDYEIRYLTGQNRLSLANRPIKVEAAEAHLQLPDKVKAGDGFKVHWEGPNHHRDLITIVPENADEGERGKVVYTKQGNPLTMKAPDQPGRYEVRYLTGQTRKTLASRRVMVE